MKYYGKDLLNFNIRSAQLNEHDEEVAGAEFDRNQELFEAQRLASNAQRNLFYSCEVTIADFSRAKSIIFHAASNGRLPSENYRSNPTENQMPQNSRSFNVLNTAPPDPFNVVRSVDKNRINTVQYRSRYLETPRDLPSRSPNPVPTMSFNRPVVTNSKFFGKQ